jgi:hypothetical protein
MMSFHSSIYRWVGWKGGGILLSTGMPASGLLTMLRMMWNRSGRSVITGLTFFDTGLYFFFAAKIAKGFGEQNHESAVREGVETCASENNEREG